LNWIDPNADRDQKGHPLFAVKAGVPFCCPLPGGAVPFFSPAAPETKKHGKLYHSASLHDIIKQQNNNSTAKAHKGARRLLKNTCMGGIPH